MPAVFFGDKVGYEECRPRNGGVFLPPAVVKEIWGRQSGDPDDQTHVGGGRTVSRTWEKRDREDRLMDRNRQKEKMESGRQR